MKKDMDVSLEIPKTVKPERIYETANIMRVWPFDVGGLILFFAAAFIPVVGVTTIAFGAHDLTRVFTTLFIPALNILAKALLKQPPISTD